MSDLGFKLRPRQQDAVDAIVRAHTNGQKTALISCPTGFGKTVVLGYLCHLLRKWQKRIIIVAHRDILLEQTKEKVSFIFEAMGGDPNDVQIVKSEEEAQNVPVAIASIQRSSNWTEGLSNRDYAIVDEAHHATARSYRRFFDTFFNLNPDAHACGVTATAFRTDKTRLSELFSSVVYHVTLGDCIAEGWLSALRARVIEMDIDMSGVRKRGGEFDARDLDGLYNRREYTEYIVRTVKQQAGDRKCVVFGVTIKHAKALAHEFTIRGMPAEAVHYKISPAKKEEIYRKYHQGELQVLCNVDLLTEGWDEPSADCVVMCRPTLSSIFFTQAIGRGLRLFPGKDECLLLDFTKNWHNHELDKPPELTPERSDKKACRDMFDQSLNFGNTDEYISAIDVFERDKSGDIIIRPKRIVEVDLIKAIYAWQKIDNHWVLNLGIDEGALVIYDADGDGLRTYLYHFHSKRGSKRLCGPVQSDFAMGIGQDYAKKQDSPFSKKTRSWRNQEPSEGQLNAMRKLGITREPENRGHAGALISLDLFLKNINRIAS